MKVTFVYPSYESIGIEYCSALLKQRGHQTSLVLDPRLFNDTFLEIGWAARLFDRHQQVVNQILDQKPDLVAFGVVTDTYRWALRTATEVKKRLDVPVVFGGIHVTSVGEVVLEEPCVDFIVRGEGEYAFAELVDSLAAGKLDCGIANIGYRATDGRRVVNPLRPTIDDLDSLPFPDKTIYDHTPLSAHNVYTVLGSRGCTFACSFCNNSTNKRLYRGKGRWLRRRSPDNVLTELKVRREQYNFSSVNFYDEIFTDDRDWVEEFCPRYAREIGAPYICCVHPRQIDVPIADLLASSGCVKIDLGVQTTDAEVRKHVVHRPETNTEIAQVFNLMRERGVSVHAENIFGLPDQTEAQLVDAARFYNENRPNVIKVYWLSYYPGTEIVKIGLEKGELDAEHVKLLERGLGTRSFATGGTFARPEYQKLFGFFALILLMPKRVVRWMLDRRLYRFLPSAGIAQFSTVVMRMINSDESSFEIMKYRYKQQYRHYIWEWLSLRLGRKSSVRPEPVEGPL